MGAVSSVTADVSITLSEMPKHTTRQERAGASTQTEGQATPCPLTPAQDVPLLEPRRGPAAPTQRHRALVPRVASRRARRTADTTCLEAQTAHTRHVGPEKLRTHTASEAAGMGRGSGGGGGERKEGCGLQPPASGERLVGSLTGSPAEPGTARLRGDSPAEELGFE